MNTDQITSHEQQIDGEYLEPELTGQILECAFLIHHPLGAGFLERLYSNALAIDFRRAGLNCLQQAPLQVEYREIVAGDYVANLLVEGRVLLELKACASLDPNHSAQIMNYLRASGIRVGLPLNFGRPQLEYSRFAC